MRLHGHTRLELTDIHTGAVEVVEKDNIITNAVGEIFNGYGGSLNKAMLDELLSTVYLYKALGGGWE